MNKRTAFDLARKINSDKDAKCEVQEFRRWPRGNWEIVVKDRRSGYTVVVGSPERWAEINQC